MARHRRHQGHSTIALLLVGFVSGLIHYCFEHHLSGSLAGRWLLWVLWLVCFVQMLWICFLVVYLFCAIKTYSR